MISKSRKQQQWSAFLGQMNFCAPQDSAAIGFTEKLVTLHHRRHPVVPRVRLAEFLHAHRILLARVRGIFAGYDDQQE